MNKKIVIYAVIISIGLCLNNAYSAGIYENANQSAEFVRTLTRYASTDIDSAYFNPAGTVLMKDGLYAYFSDQMIFDYQTMTDSSPALSAYSYPSKYEGEAMTWAFPDIYAVYKQNNWAMFVNMGLIGRGAAATYSDSIPMINKAIIQYASGVASNPLAGGGTLASIQTDGQLEAYAYFIGMTAGGAYKINEMFSLGGAIRYIHAEQNTTLKYTFNKVTSMVPGPMIVDLTNSGAFTSINVDVDANGDSAGFVGSLDVIPVTDMNIGFRYEYYTKMKVKNDAPNKFEGPAALISNPQFALSEGDSTDMTLPMNAAIGISYFVTPELKVEGGYVYYFNKETDWGKDYDNGFDASISMEYAFMQQLKGSVGYSYTMSGVNSETRNNQQLGLDANTVGMGGTYTFANGIDFTLATMIVFFKNTTEDNSATNPYDSGSTKYEDRVYNIAASVSYRFM